MPCLFEIICTCTIDGSVFEAIDLLIFLIVDRSILIAFSSWNGNKDKNQSAGVLNYHKLKSCHLDLVQVFFYSAMCVNLILKQDLYSVIKTTSFRTLSILIAWSNLIASETVEA